MGKIWKIIRAVPVLIALAVVPMIVAAKKYEVGLNDFAWFSDLENSLDLFLYWKGQALILLAFVMMICLLVSTARSDWMPEWRRVRAPEMLWLAIYMIFAVLSSVFSEYPSFAIWGSYEQWEGMFVLLSYGVLFAYVYLVADTEKAVRLIVYGIIAGGSAMGLLGTFQFLGMDLFRSKLGQAIMNLLSEKKLTYTFKFSAGWVYATLYNPNYVGSYAALLLPMLVMVALVEWKMLPRFWTVLATVGACLMTVTLLGSQSLTGCVGVAASLVFFLAYRWSRVGASPGWKKIVAAAVGMGVLAGGAATFFPNELRYGMDKLFHPKQDTFMVRQILSSERGVKITAAGGGAFYLTLTGEDEKPFVAKDAEGNEIGLAFHEGGGYYTLEGGGRFVQDGADIAELRLFKTMVTDRLMAYDAVHVVDHQFVYEKDKSWTVAKTDRGYQIYNVFKKMDGLREIPAVGFADSQHFGDKRGYIWSRTIPLLKDYMGLGSGPSTFTVVFPNDDYIGKTNLNYNGVTVTKPHNMYLQIWVQTGLPSLVAFLLLFSWYFVKSLKLYWNRPLDTVLEKVGMAVMVAVFGYMVTGIANDSTVAVAPVFWGMLGLGMAVNRLVAGTTNTE